MKEAILARQQQIRKDYDELKRLGWKRVDIFEELGKRYFLAPESIRQNVYAFGGYSSDAWTPVHHLHGMSHSRTYLSWKNMIGRCTNPGNTRWKDYGGRGIKVCDRWRHSFDNFFADMGERPIGKSIDRVNSDGNYEPGNCRWATQIEQRRNRRDG